MNKTRAGKNTPKKPKETGKIEKIYYIVIGLLIVILGGLIIFIFSNRDDALTEGDQDSTPDSELVTDNGENDSETDTDIEEPVDEETEEPAEEDTESEGTEEDEAETDSAEDDLEDETEGNREESTDEEESADDEETTEADINADAPLDESYTINFTDGSSDRNAISQNASAASGINQSGMITWWVGNNGAGRAFTIVSDSDQNSVYRVDLQYGEGSWHVTRAQELDGVPAEYR